MKYYVLFLFSLLILSCKDGGKNVDTSAKNTQPEPITDEAPAQRSGDTLLNDDRYLILSKKDGEVLVLSASAAEDHIELEILAMYGDEVVLGSGLTYEDVTVYRKYTPAKKFEDFPAALYTGPLAEPDFSSNAFARQFKTRITEGCEAGINYAGQYTLVTWGCGSPCQVGVVVDRKTGKIYEGHQTSLGSEFKKDSKLIIRNIGALDKDTGLIEPCSYCEVTQAVWTGEGFEEVE